MPQWILDDRVEFVIGSDIHVGENGDTGMVEEARGVVSLLANLERTLLTRLGRHVSEEHAQAQSSQDSRCVHVVCLARLLLGACCEAFVALKANEIAKPGTRPQAVGTCQKMARLYKDSCLAATWTSAHAQYIHDILTYGITVGGPSLHSVANESTELDLSELYSHRFSTHQSDSSVSNSLLSLMTRCTNPGSRGWDGILVGMLDENTGTKRVCSNALMISLTGMNSCIHPALRLHWKHRLGLSLHLGSKGLFAQMIPLCNNPTAFKECLRRMVSNTISSAYASNSAFAHLEHPVAFLSSCPFKMPTDGLECSSSAFAKAGGIIVESKGSAGVQEAIKRAFASMCTKPSEEDPPNVLQWNPGYLGKGTASIHHKVPATSVAASVWSMAFRCNFIPFWTHSASHNLRAARLDPRQYETIHEMNAATKLTLLLTDPERMAIQRMVLSKPSSGLMTLEEVSKLLGISNVRGSSCNGGSKGAIDSIRTLSDAGSKGAARILQFCRVAHISEDILVYDLGEKTREMQVKALYNRVLANECFEGAPSSIDEMLQMVPKHSSHLCACVECKRVANAIANDGGTKWNVSFNEIGTSGSMLSMECETSDTNLKCAKRSSASLKTAVAFEEQMSLMAIETIECSEKSIVSMICDNSTGSGTGTSARVRRDSKSALEQRCRSVACGNECMLAIPLVGRAVRLWNEWYSLCSFCGCCVRFYPSNKYHSQICCLRCDFNMLNRNAQKESKAKESVSSVAPSCRYCGKFDPMRSGARWRLVKAPLDMCGRNATLPPPLRTVHFCPKHFRSWIPSCMKIFETRVILSHIVYGAKPCFNPAESEAQVNEEDVPSSKKRKKRKSRSSR